MSKHKFMKLVERHNCTIEYYVFRPRDYDIVVDAPENYGFSGGDLSAICINNSFLENCNTAKAFWTYAYSELESELKYLTPKEKE